MSYESEKKQLADQLLRALTAMNSWTPERRVQYEITLGIVDRKVVATTDFEGPAVPEPESVAWLVAPSSVSLPLIRLLYLLDKNGDDICLNASTARAITGVPFVHGQPIIEGLLSVLKDAETAGFVRRTDPYPYRLVEADRDTIVGITVTNQGRRHLEDVLHTTGQASALRAAAGRSTPDRAAARSRWGWPSRRHAPRGHRRSRTPSRHPPGFRGLASRIRYKATDPG